MSENEVITMYVLRGNDDQTEGRGRQVDREAFVNIEDAVKVNASGKWGVQGSKNDCDIFERKWRIIDGKKWHADDVLLFGYRTDLLGKFGRGWVDNREQLLDPEFVKYLKLKEKYE